MANIIAYALYAISNDKSFALLKTIAITNKDEKGDSHTLRNKLKLTPKQYYSRISRLRKAHLIRKEHGKYYLTAFGIVVYDARMVVENAINNYYKLAAVDSLVFSDSNNMLSLEDRTNIIDSLIEDQQIKQFLIV
jgi:hypothetical protein